MTYAVNFWGSKPNTNDDCYFGGDYESFDEAQRVFNNPVEDFIAGSAIKDCSDIQWIEIDGPDFHHERQNPTFNPGTHPGEDDDDWAREDRMQRMMAFGLKAQD